MPYKYQEYSLCLQQYLIEAKNLEMLVYSNNPKNLYQSSAARPAPKQNRSRLADSGESCQDSRNFKQQATNISQNPFGQVMGCCRCQKLESKVQRLKKVVKEISLVKQQNLELQQEVELLSANFHYIMELVSENITKGVKARVGLIVQEKEAIIDKKCQIIRRMEKQENSILEQIVENEQWEEKIRQLQKKIEKLQAQNEQLKTQRFSGLPKWGQNDVESLTLSSETSNQPSSEPRLRSVRNLNGNRRSSVQFNQKNQKSTTPNESLELIASFESSNNVGPSAGSRINLDDLKWKINQIRSQLINKNF